MPAEISCRGCHQVFTARRSDAMWCDSCKIANAKRYVRDYDAKDKVSGKTKCRDCSTSIGRNAVRCRVCDNKYRKRAFLGANNPNWRKGRTRANGYVLRRVSPENLGSKAYKLEHRIVWEEAHGPIQKGWLVHHLNGIKDDNRLENLLAISQKDHHTQHEAYRQRIRNLEAEVVRLSN